MKALFKAFLLLFACSLSCSAQPSFLDSAFGNNGIVLTHIGSATSSGSIQSIQIQSDNKIVAGGSIICRYNVDGTLDNSFGASGMITRSPSYAIAL
jgi:hypothetical protein